jgi:hypothetical protein
MHRTIGGLILAGIAAIAGARPYAAPQGSAPFSGADDARATIDKYCVTCHNERLKTGGLSLVQINLQDVSASALTLEKVVRKLQARSMPPAGAPRPDVATYDRLNGWLEAELDRSSSVHPNAGRTEALHRLNRVEYKNAIRDLLGIEGLEIEKMLPTDDASYGFDNIAGVLGVSPTHVERYLAAARKISRLAVGDTSIPPYGESQVTPLDYSQEDRLEALPLGTRGGLVIRRYFPVDAEYLLKFQTVTGFGTSADEPNYVEVSVDGERVYYAQVIQQQAVGVNDDFANTDYELRLPVKAGIRTLAITFVDTTRAEAEDLLQPYLRPPTFSLFKHARLGGYAGPYVSLMSVTGPMNATASGDSPSRKRLFVCRPASPGDELPCARRIISTLQRRAYRRPPTDTEVNGVLEFYKQRRAAGGFDKGIRVAVERVLSSPDFLFRIERQPNGVKPGEPYAVSDLELASRLSFFLWSSIPDDQLIDLAGAGRLHDRAVLTAQVTRMLQDPRSDALVANFAGQWLRLRNVDAVLPDTRMFPDFDQNLRSAFRRETELFVNSIIKEDRSALDLIGANYTFVNERLARHYGISNVYGSEFRRVTMTDGRRGGLLGQGAILVATSQPNRTSPVVRGKWILESLLAAPPPAPPANVPALDATPVAGTLRQRMEQHRKNPVCASCHKVMDPLGFALENFDPVGAWRTAEGTNPVDTTGTMPDGTTFDGVAGLRHALLARPEVFVYALTEKLMIYALGRGTESYDAPAIRAVVRDAAKSDYRFSSIVLGIVNSLPFRMRQADVARALPAATSARRQDQ